MESTMLVLGRYQLGARIGQGGMGTVYRAVDTETGVDVAVKQLRRDGASRDPSTIERLRREGEALRRLNHPNIVRVLAVGSDSGQDQIVMEFIGGGSIADLISSARSPLHIERVLDIALDLCDALARSHRLDIVHRDLKPSNVLMADDGTPRLSDFGAAYFKGRTRITQERSIVGTIEYICPEALAGEELDARADIWSLGVLLFEMLTCQHPFARENLGLTIANIAAAAPPDLETLRPECPVALADLVRRMLVKEPERRVQSVRQVAAELDAILHERSGSGRRGSVVLATSLVPNNLPARTSTLVGRSSEIVRLRSLLETPDIRLVSIVAPGGMGKTRLAIELAQSLLTTTPNETITRFSARATNGVFLVQLAALASPELIPTAIAEAIGFQFHPGREPLLQLTDYLRNKRLLLLLDNFEHLLDGAPIVSDLLHASSGLTVIATSRERLSLSGERLFTLDGLSLPDDVSSGDNVATSGAVGLFLQVARNAKPDFEIDTGNSLEIVRVCRLVEGVPLGIILAASWIGTLEPREIADEISIGLDFLSARLRDLPERQRSMRAAFEHSWSLLTLDERAVLMGISVFRGGFTREAARDVVGATVRSLDALTNKSLLRRMPGHGRYEVHELLRQFAESKLVEQPEAQQRLVDAHASYYAQYLSQRLEMMRSPIPRHVMAELELEVDNVRAAWTALVAAHRLVDIAGTIDSLELFLTRRAALAEGEGIFRAFVESFRVQGQATSRDERDDRAATLRRMLELKGSLLQATFMRLQGRYGQAIARFREVLSLLDDDSNPCVRAYALVSLGGAEGKAGKLVEAKALAERGVALYREAADRWNLASALETLGWLYAISGDLVEAEHVYREAVEVQSASGYLPSGLMGLGTVTADQGRYEPGCKMLDQALRLFETVGDDWNKLRCRSNLANVQRKLGNYPVAESLARDCLAFAEQIGNWDHEAWARFQLANVLKHQGRVADAAVQVKAAHQRSLMVSDVAKIALAELEFGDLAMLRGDLGDAERLLTVSLRRFESSGHAWGVVLALDLLAFIDCLQGRFHQSQTRFALALRMAMGSHMYPFATNIVAGVAHLCARLNEQERAVEFLALAEYHTATERQTIVRRVRSLREQLRRCMSPERFRRAKLRGRAMKLESVELSFLGAS